MNKDLLKEWRSVAKEIRKHEKLYSAGIPLIADNYYDMLKERLSYIEDIIGSQPNSPLVQIGSAQTSKNKVAHTHPMLSLDNGFGIDAIKLFINRLGDVNCFPMVCEYKVDGVAVALHYDQGRLYMALSRGNGKFGIDITKQIQNLNIPKHIDYMGELEIRGEMYLTYSSFEAIRNEFTSTRNACASILQSKIPPSHIKPNFMCYNLIEKISNTYNDQMEFLESLGFTRVPYKMAGDIEDCIKYFEEVLNNRSQIDFALDGIVLKLNDLDLWSQLGSHRTAPRYAFAVKFMATSYPTVIRQIDIQVGKFGIITPVSSFDPVNIDGHIITRATLHNINELNTHRYGVGDTIEISRSGDAIPYIRRKTADANNWLPISHCPSCGSVLEKFEQTLRCTQAWDCKEQQIQRILHFCSRNGFNIGGFGEQNIRELVTNNIISRPNDIFSLPLKISNSEINLKEIGRWGPKSIQNMTDAVNRARHIQFANFLFALGIPNIGYGNAQTISNYYNNFTTFSNDFLHDQSQVMPGIGEVIINSIVSFLKNPNESWIYRLDNVEILA